MEITIAKDNNDTENREKNGDVREDRTRKRKENDDDKYEIKLLSTFNTLKYTGDALRSFCSLHSYADCLIVVPFS